MPASQGSWQRVVLEDLETARCQKLLANWDLHYLTLAANCKRVVCSHANYFFASDRGMSLAES